MVRIVRRSRRPPLMTCLIVVFSFVAVGILTVAGILVAVIFLSAESSGSSPTGTSSSVGSPSSDSDGGSGAASGGGSGARTTAPVSGGWSSGG